MGNFYVSFAAQGANQAAVVAVLKVLQRKSFVSPQRDGFVYFYDEASDAQDGDEIDKLGAAVSKELATAVFVTMNHDDDVLFYWLFSSGELMDTYNSFPGFFDSDDETEDEDEGVLPKGGDAALLIRTLGATSSARKVHTLLRADNEQEAYVFAVDRHLELATLLGLSCEFACLGYRYIADGASSDIPDREQFVEVK